MSDMFRVFQFFPDESSEEVTPQPVEAKEAVEKAVSLTKNVACRTGLVQRVIITDSGDNCVFDWIYGQGVVFPPRPVAS